MDTTRNDIEATAPFDKVPMTEMTGMTEMTEMGFRGESTTTEGDTFFGITDHFYELNRKHKRRRAAAGVVIFTIYGTLLRFTNLGIFILLFLAGNIGICLFIFNQRRFIKNMTNNRAKQTVNNAVESVSVGWEKSKIRNFFATWKERRQNRVMQKLKQN